MSGGVIAQQTNINSDQYFFVLANGQQINVSTLIATNGYFSTITGDTATISSIISQNISTISLFADTAIISSIQSSTISTINLFADIAIISSIQSSDVSTINLSVSTINNLGLSSFNIANWAQYPAIQDVGSQLQELFVSGLPTGIYEPIYSINNFKDIQAGNLNARQFLCNYLNCNYYGGFINADNGISANTFSGNNAGITAIGCASLDAGNSATNIGVISAYGVNRPPGFNALYAQGGVTLDGGGTIHGITIGTQPVLGVNSIRIDVLPVGIDMASATYVTVDAGGAINLAAGGAVSLAGGSYIELNTANINCIDTTYPGSCVLNVDNIFPSQNGRGNLNNFDLYNCGAPNSFNASNISTNQLSSCNIDTSNINTSNILINTSNNISIGYNSLYDSNNPFLPSSFVSSVTVNNCISNLHIYNTPITSNDINFSNTTLQNINGVDYYVYDALGSNFFSNVFSNSINTVINDPALVNFGTDTAIGYGDFYNQGSVQPLYIQPPYEVAYTGFASIPAGANQRVFVDPSFQGIRVVDIASIYPLYPSTFYSSIYLVDTFLTQNISSCSLTVDISGYDTNNNQFITLGDFQINSSKVITDTIYVNTISAGNIIGSAPTSDWSLYPAVQDVNLANNNIVNTNTITGSNISTNNISSAVIYTTEIYTKYLGQPNPYSNISISVNNGFDMGNNSISNVNKLSCVNLSSLSIVASNISTNSLNVSNISTSVIYTTEIYTQYLGQPNPYSNISISVNNGFDMGNNNISNVNKLSCVNISSLSIVASNISTNSLNVNSISAGNIIGGINQTNINSTIDGLGTLGYISSSQLTSTVRGLGDIYISSAGAGQTAITSSIIGLGTFGYISSSQLTSTVRGLGNIYISSAGAGQTAITSSIIGLGTFGYISSSQLTSTVRGLGDIYISSAGAGQTAITSTIIGLGTFGYISSSQLTSTITGWSGIPANKNLNMGNNNISNVQVLYADVINPNTLSIVNFLGGIGVQNVYAEPVGQVIYINDAVQFQSNAQFNAGIDLSFNNISNVNNIYFTEAIGSEIIIDYIYPNDFVDVKISGPLNLCNNNISNVNTLYYNEISGNQVIANSLTIIDTSDNYTTTFSNYEYGAIFDTNSSQYGFTNSGGTETAVIQVEYAGVGGGFLYVDNTGAFHLSNNVANKVVVDNNLATDYIYSNSNSVVQFTNNSIDLNNNSISNINMLEFNDADDIDFGTIILSNGYFSYTSVLSPSIFLPIASDWWMFVANGDINVNNNSITNISEILVDYINPNNNSSVAITGNGLQVDYLTTYGNHYIEVDSDFDVLGNFSSDSIEPYSSNGINFNQTILSNFTQLVFTSNTDVGGLLITTNSKRAGSLISLSNADFSFANQNIYNGGDYTGTSISTISISTSAITVSNINNVAFPLIQFGIATVNTTVSLSNNYRNSNYSVLLTYSSGASGIISLYGSNIDISSFYVGGSPGYECSWMTIGF